MFPTHYIRSFELQKDKLPHKKEYPYNLPVVQYLDNINLHEKVTFFVGENGTGKSTLLEALAVGYGFNAEGGSKNFNFSTYESHSSLSQALKLIKGIHFPKDGFFLRAESYYNLASSIEELDKIPCSGPRIIDGFWGTSLHEQSHGESFFSLFLHRFRGNGLYILDEPEAALSPQRQLAFLVRLHELIEQNSQFIIATHSPILLSYPHAKVIEISQNGFQEICYQDSEHYTLYKQFLENPEYMLGKLGILE